MSVEISGDNDAVLIDRIREGVRAAKVLLTRKRVLVRRVAECLFDELRDKYVEQGLDADDVALHIEREFVPVLRFAEFDRDGKSLHDMDEYIGAAIRQLGLPDQAIRKAEPEERDAHGADGASGTGGFGSGEDMDNQPDDTSLIDLIRDGDKARQELLRRKCVKGGVIEKVCNGLWSKSEFREAYYTQRIEREDLFQFICEHLLSREEFRSFDIAKVPERGVDGYLYAVLRTSALPLKVTKQTGGTTEPVRRGDATDNESDNWRFCRTKPVKLHLLSGIAEWWGGDANAALEAVAAVFTESAPSACRCLGIRHMVCKGAGLGAPGAKPKRSISAQVSAEWLYGRRLLLSCYARA